MDVSAVRNFAATFVTDTTNPPTPRHPRLRRGRFDLVEVADVITALICFAVANSALSEVNAAASARYPTGLVVLLAFLTCAPLALRTRFPLTAWAACALAIIGTSLAFQWHVPSNGYLPVAVLVYGLCLYAVTVRCQPRITVAATVVTLAGAAVFDPGSTVVAVFLTAVPLLLGAVVRQRRSGERQLEEQERRHSGERALLEERQRIARELHDVVAHHMSVIAIQAEAAPYKVAEPPPELVESFSDIRASALAGLTELRRVLGVLRTGGQSTAPQPGLDGLDALLDSARSGGVSVIATRSGDPVALPDGVELSAYRIVQEALSNAMRHAPGSHVEVQVEYRPEGLALEVRNDAGRRPATAATGTVPVGGTNAGENGAGGASGQANGTPGPPDSSGGGRADGSQGGRADGTPGSRADGSRGGRRDGDLTSVGGQVSGGGHGIIGMRERAAMLGGSLDASPTDDGGFRVIAVLPATHDGHGDAA